MKKTLQILNLLSVVFAIGANTIVSIYGIAGHTIKEMSDMYSTFLTPATYAFSIWSLIYLLIALLAIYQARDLFHPEKSNTLPQRLGWYFILANIGNGIWTYIFISGFIGLSVIVILILLASLFIIIWRLRMALDDEPFPTIVFLWWPILLYTGWVLAASVVDIASFLSSVGVVVSALASAIVVVLLSLFLLWLLQTRNVRELVLASTWAILAVAVANMGVSTLVAGVAYFASAVLLLAIMAHGYKNRALGLGVKFRQFREERRREKGDFI
jgi:benzodiazapine receptor